MGVRADLLHAPQPTGLEAVNLLLMALNEIVMNNVNALLVVHYFTFEGTAKIVHRWETWKREE